METKWTKGPWKAFNNAGSNMQSYSQSSGVITADNKKIVCGCFRDIGGGKVAEANAQLIASAPDLYAALKRAHEHMRVMGWAIQERVDCRESYQMADAALRQARGEQ